MAQNVEEMVIKWSIDSTNFDKGVTSINRSMNVLKSEFKATDTDLKNFGSTTEQLKNKQEYLSKSMELQAKKIQTLKTAYEKSKAATGENSAATERLAIQVNNATSYYSNLDKQLQDVNTDLGQYNEKATDSANTTSKIGATMVAIGEGAQALGQKIENITSKIKELSQVAISNYKEVKSGTDEVIKATGATGDAADDLKESFKNVASDSTADFKVIGSTLGEINTRFGFTGDSAEECTNKFIAFSKVTNSDATEAVKNVSRYMGDASINSDQYSKVLDNLAKASQASGISISNLTENLTKYGAPMRALGFDTEQSIALFSSWEKVGVNTEIAFSGMKKSISNWSAAGKDSREEFKKTLTEIKNCPDIASATTKAIEIFGQKAGPDLADAIKGGRFEYEDMLNTIQSSEGTVSGTLKEMSDGSAEYIKAQNFMKVASAEFGAEITSTLAPMLKSASEKIKDLSGWFRGLGDDTKDIIVKIGLIVTAIGPALVVFGVMASSVGKLITLYGIFKGSLLATRLGVIGLTIAEKAKILVDKAGAIAQAALNLVMSLNPVGLVIIGITALIALAVLLYKKCTPFRAFIDGIWASIKITFGNILPFLKTVFNATVNVVMIVFNAIKDYIVNTIEDVKTIWNFFKDFYIAYWNTIKTIVETVWNWIKNKIDKTVTDIKNMWNTVVNAFNVVGSAISSVWNSITSTISNVWSGVVSGVISAWNTIKAPFESVVNGIKSVWEGLKSMFKLPHFSIQGSFSLDPPSIPSLGVEWYANGGIMTQSTLFGMNGSNAMIGGEAGAEAILPLSMLFNNLDKMLDEKLNSRINNNQTFIVQNVLDGKIIGQETYEVVDNKFAMVARGSR